MHRAVPLCFALMLGCAGDAGPEAVRVRSLAEDLRIGSIDDAATSLTMVTGLQVGPDGALYVAQPMDQQIRVFGPDGEARGVIGRPGEGPGEFGSVSALGWRGDTLFVADGRSRRVHFFSADGRFLGESNWVSVATPRPELLPSVPGVLLEDGTVIMQYSAFADAMETGDVTTRPWVLLDRTGTLLDTVFDAPVDGNQLSIRYGESGALYAVQPWTTDPLFLPDHDGEPLYIVDPLPAGENGVFRITRIGSRGDTSWTRALPFETVPIDAARRDSAVTELATRLEGFRGRQGLSIAEMRSKVDEAVRAPAVVPPVRRGFVADDGALWLERQDRPGIWTVLDDGGQVGLEVRVPEGVRLLHADAEAVYGVITDDLDVPYVVRLRIIDGADP